jgi:hypothetical protein
MENVKLLSNSLFCMVFIRFQPILIVSSCNFCVGFRLKFPHVTRGSLASSAVVLAVQDFAEFDQQVKIFLFSSSKFLLM